jgi:hypothetical protein
MELFEKAARQKTRFPTSRGWASIEDLWDLSLEELDDIFKNLNARLRSAQEESLLEAKRSADEELTLQIDIIKHVVAVKLEEKANALSAKQRADEKQKLLTILATKKAAALENLSEAEIEAKLAELG